MDSLVTSYANLDAAARARLHRHGVSTETMLAWPGPVGVADVDIHALDIFSFTDAGQRAFVHPIYSASIYSEIIDVVTWLPAAPSRWWTLHRTGWSLGDDHLHAAEFWSQPIVLHPHPLAWLAAGGEGVVVMDWIMSAPALRSVPSIITDDEKFGREVKRRLTMAARTCPEIRIRVERVAA